MGWRVWGDDFTDTEMLDSSKAQAFTTNKNLIVKAFRTWFIFINDPIFVSLSAKIYSNEVVGGVNVARELVASSTDSRTKSELITLENGVKETYFTFDDIPLQQNTVYNLVINGTGYSSSETSYICWMKAFPDPVLPNNFAISWEKLYQSPYQIYLIAGEI